MFGKLLKNDLKAQWYSMSTIFLCVFVVGVSAELLTVFAKNKVMGALGGLIVVACLFFTCAIVLIAEAMMFSKTMFGRAGYLTLSLPVSNHSLLWSKTLSGLIWLFSIYILFIGSILLWMKQAIDILGQDTVSSMDSILSLFGAPSFNTISMSIIGFCVAFAITILLLVQCLHFGITCSNVSPVSKLGVIGAIIIFFVVFGIVQGVANGLSDVFRFGMVITPKEISFTSDIVKTALDAGKGAVRLGFCGPLVRLIFAVALHFPTAYLIEKKVNVK